MHYIPVRIIYIIEIRIKSSIVLKRLPTILNTV